MGISFRIAVPGDAPALAALAGELGYPASAETLFQRLDCLSDEDAVLVACDDATVVGWIHVAEHASLTEGRFGLIVALIVSEARRGGGIGRALVAEAESWARARGLTVMRLRSRESRTGAHRFYRLLGYGEQKTQVAFRKELS